MKVQKLYLALWLTLLFAAACLAIGQSKGAFDLVITNGHVIDGTGSPWYSSDIGVRAGRIAAIGAARPSPGVDHERITKGRRPVHPWRLRLPPP